MEKFERNYYSTNRTLCGVLEEMRSCLKTLNFGAMAGLIEEAQVFGNRMEAGLSDKSDLAKLSEDVSKARRHYKDLVREIRKLEKKAKVK
jgi:hypothetical protein